MIEQVVLAGVPVFGGQRVEWIEQDATHYAARLGGFMIYVDAGPDAGMWTILVHGAELNSGEELAGTREQAMERAVEIAGNRAAGWVEEQGTVIKAWPAGITLKLDSGAQVNRYVTFNVAVPRKGTYVRIVISGGMTIERWFMEPPTQEAISRLPQIVSERPRWARNVTTEQISAARAARQAVLRQE